MARRLGIIGIAIAFIGVLFVGAGGYAYLRYQQGADSLKAFSAAQNVRLSYNEDGVLIDRGEVAGAEAIMALLVDEWAYPVADSEFNPNDPVVNTASEYMFQLATITYHVLHGTQTVVLDETVEYNGETFKAGTYEVPVEGRYFADFDRSHPLEGPARAAAWSPLAHGLIGELGVGTATATALQMALAMAGLFAAIGGLAIFSGLGLFWASRKPVEVPVEAVSPVTTPTPAGVIAPAPVGSR
jgi:hypothetical protein